MKTISCSLYLTQNPLNEFRRCHGNISQSSKNIYAAKEKRSLIIVITKKFEEIWSIIEGFSGIPRVSSNIF